MFSAQQTEPAHHFTVVDDDDKMLFFVQRALAQKFPGADILTFTDGVDAFQYLKKNGTDFLITDFSMARMGGADLIRELRAARIEVPTLMISGSPNAEETALELGVIFLDKGKINERLADAVSVLLAK
ncbi:MAG: two-component system, cell cycle sensor histidine kinase and response regulator CckA [Verrucomicrobiota bacterium]|jgi:DNA-binding response OmpR family regulator